MLLPTATYVAYMNMHSEPAPPWRMLLAGYLGTMLLGGSLLALGSFISSLTENQQIAAVLTFAAFLMIWVIDIGRNAEGTAGTVLQYLSVIHHYDDFTRGVIDTSGLIYYGSFIFLFCVFNGALGGFHPLAPGLAWQSRSNGPGGIPRMKADRREMARFAVTIGVAFAIAGYLRYSIQGEFLLVNKLLLVFGGVLIASAAAVGLPDIVKFFSKRSSKLGTNTSVLSTEVLAILVIVNFAGYQHHKRFDLTSEKLFTLSDQTKQIVQGLKQDVTIVRFAKAPDPAFTDLMAEYRGLSEHIKSESVDPQEKPDVAKEYSATHVGDIVVASGSRKEPLTASPEGGPAEQDVTSAILKVTSEKQKTVCFVTGHGEKALSDDQGTGYSTSDQALKREGYATKAVNLVTDNGVPADCDVLAIDGPTQAYFPPETASVQKYLSNGGKALIEVDPETDPKLDAIFQAWNINVGDNVVIDASGVGQTGSGAGNSAGGGLRGEPHHQGFDEAHDILPAGAHGEHCRQIEIRAAGNGNPEDFGAQLYDTQDRA